MVAPALAAPVVSDPTAVYWRRAIAAVIDLALILVPAAMLVTAGLEYHTEDTLRGAGVTPSDFCRDLLDDGGVCIDFTDVDDRVYFADDPPPAPAAYAFGSSFLLLVVLQGLTGWSPGKLLTGVRVVKADGSVVGFVKALVRWLLWVVDGFPYCLPLVGPILGLTTPGHRRLGDVVARTFVVRSSSVGTPVSVPGLEPAPQAYAMPIPPSPMPPSPVAPTPAPAPGTTAPHWDVARGTYIQWDPSQAAWMQWDDATRTWVRMPGQ